MYSFYVLVTILHFTLFYYFNICAIAFVTKLANPPGDCARGYREKREVTENSQHGFIKDKPA